MTEKKKSWVQKILSNLVFLIFLLFSIWFIGQESADFLPTIFSIISIVLFCAAITKGTIPLESLWFIDESAKFLKTFVPVFNSKKPYLFIFIGSIFWLCIMNMILIICIKNYYPLNSIKEAFEAHFSAYLDTKNYIHIAKFWYTSQDIDYTNYNMVFPLYPILLYILNFFNNYNFTGMVISTLFAIGSSILLYSIALFDYDETTSMLAVKYLFIFPSAFFLVLPLSESLLLFFSLLYVYLIRKREWGYSFFAGYFAGMVSPYALVLMIFSAIEFISMVREEYIEGKYYKSIDLLADTLHFLDYKEKCKYIIPTILKGLSILCVPIAYLFYIFLNRDIYFNEVKFILFFKDLFKTQPTYFFSNAFYLISDITKNLKLNTPIIYSTLLPNLIALFSTLILLLLGYKKIRASYYIYSLVYFLVIFASKPLVSSPRLLLTMFPLFIIASALSNKLAYNILISTIFICGFVSYFILFLLGYPVY